MKIRRFGRTEAGLFVPPGGKPKVSLPADFTGLMIGIPAYGSAIHTGCSRSINSATVMLSLMGIYNDVCYLVSESMVTRARDQLLAIFMGSPKFSHLLMVDSDVEFPREATLRLLADCRFHDMVMCIYPKKKQPLDFAVFWTPEQIATGLNVSKATGCVEIEAGPAGFFMMTRKTVQRMMDAHPELKYGAGQPFDETRFALFNPFMTGQALWSEDISFCKRWRALGGSVWMNPYFDLTHWTGNVPFKGHTLDIFQTGEAAKEETG